MSSDGISLSEGRLIRTRHLVQGMEDSDESY